MFIPDLFAYFLTGAKRTEITFTGTTNLLDPVTKQWDWELIEKLGMPKSIFADIIKPGETYGLLKEDIAEELGCPQVPVIAVASHDTASAIFSIPTSEKDFVSISCGTWSLSAQSFRILFWKGKLWRHSTLTRAGTTILLYSLKIL